MSTVGDTISTPGGYHEYSKRIPWVHWRVLSTLGDIMSTLGTYHDECGGIISTAGGVQYTGGLSWVHWGNTKIHVRFSWVHWGGGGVLSTPDGYHEYTRGCRYEWGKAATNFRGFVFSCLLLLLLLQLYMLAFGTSDSLLKFLHQVARAQTLTLFLFHLWSNVLYVCCCKMNKNLCSFLLQAPKKFRQNDSHYLLQAFLNECEQACRGVHDNEFCTWQSGYLPLIFWLVICKSLTSLLFCWNSSISLLWLRSMKTLFWLSAVGVSSSLQ